MLKRGKKGQITVFIIVGIFILAIVGGMTYLNKYVFDQTSPTPKISTEAAPIKLFVESCLKKTSEEALIKIGRQGGYYKVPDESVTMLFERTPFYYLNLKMNLPSISRMEQEISKYIQNNLDSCLKNFSIFTKQGYNLDFKLNKLVDLSEIAKDDTLISDLIVTTNIHTLDVVIDLKFPLEITKGNQKSTISYFQSKLPIRLGKIYSTIQMVIEDYAKKPGHICLTCLDKIKDTSIKVNVVPQKDVFWFLITDNKSIINNENYFFKFVVESLADELNETTIIYPIGQLNAFAGKAFEYQINATGEDLVFFDDTGLFDVDKLKGIINFTPTKNQIGNNLIEIIAQDKKGNQASEIFLLNISSSISDPIIDYIGLQQAFSGKQFIYPVNVTNLDKSQVTFSDNTSLFNISDQGLINFTPLANISGSYSIEITATTKEGGSDKTKMDLVVTQ